MADPKRFYHAISDSTIVLEDGRVLSFSGGYLDIDPKDEVGLAALEGIADKPGTMVVSMKAKVAMDKAIGAAAEQVIGRAAEIAAAIGKQQAS